MTVMQDFLIFIKQIVNFFKFIPWIYNHIKSFFEKVKNIVFRNKAVEILETAIPNSIDIPIKVGIFKRLSYIFKPKAKLTYWLADEEVIVYIDDFKQKDKFKLIFRELISGRTVMVNSANPINYRLEQLKPEDEIKITEIQQNQHY